MLFLSAPEKRIEREGLRFPYAGPNLQPIEIGGWNGGEFIDSGGAYKANRLRHHPAMWFNVAVGERKIRGATVIGCRQIAPAAVLQAGHQKNNVYLVGIVIHAKKKTRC